MESLPPEVQEKIIDRMTWVDAKNCLLVCKFWYSIVRSILERKQIKLRNVCRVPSFCVELLFRKKMGEIIPKMKHTYFETDDLLYIGYFPHLITPQNFWSLVRVLVLLPPKRFQSLCCFSNECLGNLDFVLVLQSLRKNFHHWGNVKDNVTYLLKKHPNMEREFIQSVKMIVYSDSWFIPNEVLLPFYFFTSSLRHLVRFFGFYSPFGFSSLKNPINYFQNLYLDPTNYKLLGYQTEKDIVEFVNEVVKIIETDENFNHDLSRLDPILSRLIEIWTYYYVYSDGDKQHVYDSLLKVDKETRTIFLHFVKSSNTKELDNFMIDCEIFE